MIQFQFVSTCGRDNLEIQFRETWKKPQTCRQLAQTRPCGRQLGGKELLVKSHTGKGTPLHGAGLDRWPWDGDKLNRPLLDGDWLGEASLDHLLGDVELARLLLNNVGHASWMVHPC